MKSKRISKCPGLDTWPGIITFTSPTTWMIYEIEFAHIVSLEISRDIYTRVYNLMESGYDEGDQLEG